MLAPMPLPDGTSVSAVVLSHQRRDAVHRVLSRLRDLPVDEVVLVDCASTDGTVDMVRRDHPSVVVVDPGGNVGTPGRNVGVARASHEHVLMLDDDAYPLPGAVEALVATLAAAPLTAAVGGLVRDVREPPPGTPPEEDTEVVLVHGPGTFDWWLGGDARDIGPAGVRSFFFPEGASMVRRSRFLEAGGFYGPFFNAAEGIDLATRLVGHGYEVRYQPAAVFDHMKVRSGRLPSHAGLRYRVRNQLWYFWRHFPPGLRARRMAAYLLFDLAEAVFVGAVHHWWRGVRDAWTLREQVRADVRPLPREVLRVAEGRRGRRHVELLALQLRNKSRRALSRSQAGRAAQAG